MHPVEVLQDPVGRPLEVAKRTADGISDTKIGTPADWITVGAASWLAERLKDLGFRFATPCQANTLRAHIKLVIESGVESDGTEVDSSRFEEVWRDIALRAPTGHTNPLLSDK